MIDLRFWRNPGEAGNAGSLTYCSGVKVLAEGASSALVPGAPGEGGVLPANPSRTDWELCREGELSADGRRLTQMGNEETRGWPRIPIPDTEPDEGIRIGAFGGGRRRKKGNGFYRRPRRARRADLTKGRDCWRSHPIRANRTESDRIRPNSGGGDSKIQGNPGRQKSLIRRWARMGADENGGRRKKTRGLAANPDTEPDEGIRIGTCDRRGRRKKGNSFYRRSLNRTRSDRIQVDQTQAGIGRNALKK